jgi:hypothetical protein
MKSYLKLKKKKNKDGISTTLKRIHKKQICGNEIRFSDGEEWIIVNPNMGARGYRWRRAWIDASNTSISQLQNCILPYGSLYQWEKEKYFNW